MAALVLAACFTRALLSLLVVWTCMGLCTVACFLEAWCLRLTALWLVVHNGN